MNASHSLTMGIILLGKTVFPRGVARAAAWS